MARLSKFLIKLSDQLVDVAVDSIAGPTGQCITVVTNVGSCERSISIVGPIV